MSFYRQGMPNGIALPVVSAVIRLLLLQTSDAYEVTALILSEESYHRFDAVRQSRVFVALGD